MALVSCIEAFEKRRSILKDGNVQHIFTFKVITNDPNDGTVLATYCEGLPVIGDTLEGDDAVVCTQIECNPVDKSKYVFETLVTFSSGDPLASSLNPLDRPPSWSFPGTNASEPYFTDFSTNGPNGGGVPVTNSAGDTFEQLPERDVAQLQINMTRNEATWNILAIDAIANTTNNGTVYLDGQAYATGTLRLGLPTGVKTSEQWQGQTVVYYKISYVFHANAKGWNDNILDVGYNEIQVIPANTSVSPDTNPVSRVPIVDAANMKITKPWPLDGTGHALESATDTPATLTFVKYLPADWSSLRLS